MKAKYRILRVLIVLFATSLIGSVGNGNLVAHWALDGNANDSIGGNHGTIVGNPTWVAGQVGGGLKLDGVDDYVETGYTANLPVWTISVWVSSPASPSGGADRASGPVYRDSNYQIAWSHQTAGSRGTAGVQVGGSFYRASFGTLEANTWYHLAATYDGETLTAYKNGILITSNTVPSGNPNSETDTLKFGRHSSLAQYFAGTIDDVAIFDHALNEQEVAQLCRLGGISFTLPTLQMLLNAILRAETLVEEQKAREAVALIKKTIAEYEQWKQQNPNDITLGHKVLSCDLHFLSAKAQEAVGAPKAGVADMYKRAVESGILSPPRQGPALLWLYENTDADTYDSVVVPFITNDGAYLKEVAAQAEAMVREQKSKAAAGFLAGNLAAYARWREKHPFDEVIAEDMLPEVHFQLAKAGEAAGAPKKDVADAYSNTFNRSRFDYVPERAATLIWLVENERTDECTKAIKSFTQSRDIRDCFKKVVAKVCEHFESQRNWAQFQWFLDALFTEAEYPYDWVVFVESCLGDKTGRWAQAYYAYLDSRPKLKFGRDCIIAEKYATDKKFMKAVELYQDIVNRCGPEDDKGLLECQLCKCLFYGGQYREAVAKLGSFIVNNKATHGSLVKEAMLMKGRAHVQLGEIDKAIDAFLTVMIEYPETKEAPETNFFVGYCYMLQSKFDQAKEALNLVTQEHPESSYAGRARMCLIRIEDMTQ